MWFAVALAGHLSNALAFLFDKALLTKRLPHPGVAAFWVGSGSVLALLLLIFDPRLPADASEWWIDLLGGFLFIAALSAFYVAVRREEVSTVVPIVGAQIPLMTALSASALFDAPISGSLWRALVVITFGMLILIWRRGTHVRAQYLVWMAFTALLFALSSVIMDAAFATQGFITAFAWSRVGSLIAAFLLLTHRPTRRALFRPVRAPAAVGLLGLSQSLGVLGFFLVNLAISMRGAVMVNSLQGLQYVFLFALAFVASKRFPRTFHESFSKSVILQKSLGIFVIIVGLVLLSLG